MKSNKRYLKLPDRRTVIKYDIKTKRLQYIGEAPTISDLVYASQVLTPL